MSVKIIAGKFRGVSIDVPAQARPTLSRNRRSLFDVLESIGPEIGRFFIGKTVLDCFAGSGAFGFEALSRGADRVYFVDISKESSLLLHLNAKKLKVENSSTIIHCNVRHLKKLNLSFKACDIAFLDPPYGKTLIAETLKRLLLNEWITKNTLVITEESVKSATRLNEGNEGEIVSRIYGNSVFKISSLEKLFPR